VASAIGMYHGVSCVRAEGVHERHTCVCLGTHASSQAEDWAGGSSSSCHGVARQGIGKDEGWGVEGKCLL